MKPMRSIKSHIASITFALAIFVGCSSESRNSTADTSEVLRDSISPLADSSPAPTVSQPTTTSDASTPDSGAATANPQGPGQRIAVAIQIRSVATRADTVRVDYQVKTLVNSAESLVAFHVDAPSGVLRISRPGLRGEWAARTAYRGRPMATWTSGSTIPPGAISPELHFESVGVPGIVTFWAEGEHEPASADEEGAVEAYGDPLVKEMITGKTVGVDPWPKDRSSSALIARLRGLTQSTCNAPLRWITDPRLCDQLLTDIRDGENYVVNQPARVKRAMDHYITLLGVDAPAPGVTNAAYWLLRSNAELLERLL